MKTLTIQRSDHVVSFCTVSLACGVSDEILPLSAVNLEQNSVCPCAYFEPPGGKCPGLSAADMESTVSPQTFS